MSNVIENLNGFPTNLSYIDFLRGQGQVEQQYSLNPAIKYRDGENYSTLNYQQFIQFINGSAIYLKPKLEGIVADVADPIPIAFLAPNTKEYIINLLGLVALNLAPIALSVKNSDEILAALIAKSGTKVLAYHPQFQTQADYIKIQVPELNLVILPSQSDIVPSLEVVEPISKRELNHNYEEDILTIFHSSGSTSLPKLIKFSNRYAFEMILRERDEYLSEFYHQKVALQFAPFFHAYGFINFIKISARYSCLAIPSSVLNTKSYLDDITNYRINYLIIVPSLLDQLADYCTENNVWDALKPIELVVTGGTALPNKMVQKFVKQSIHILNDYGSTETGNLAASTLDVTNKNFQRFHLLPHVKYSIINRNEDLGQILIHPDDKGLANGMVKPEEDGFLINDIVQIFKETNNYIEFEILGRVDDLIIHLNGEKTNPVPMEQDIKALDYVDQCIILGNSQLYNAAIIELNKNKLKGKSLEKVRDEILVQIEITNRKNPQHSRLLPELIHILDFNSKYNWPLTAKGNFKRHECSKLFQPILDQLYITFANLQNSDIQFNINRNFDSLTFEQLTQQIVNYLIQTTNNTNIDFNKSYFNQGLDSLSVVQFFKLIKQQYPELNLSITLIYENDTVYKLTNYSLNQLKKKIVSIKDLKEHQLEIIKVVDTYSNSINSFLINNSYKEKKVSDKKIVLITGGNGSLGSLLIKKLIRCNDVVKVYCLIRSKTNQESKIKFDSIFQQRRTNVTDEQYNKVECLLYDQMDSQFGLDSNIYQTLLDNVNVIYHCAYKMNFLLPLSNFDDCILSCTNLIQFNYLTTFKSKFHFVSSIGAILPLQYNNLFEEEPLHPELKNIDFCNGYNLSKLVLELVLTKFSKQFNDEIFIYRLGQLSGDKELGIWNTQDYMPKFIQLIQQIGIAPKNFFFDAITWVPMDTTVNALIDLTFNDVDNNIFHIINPNPVPWLSFLQDLQEVGIQFQIVDNEQFVKRLETMNFHLKDFFVQHTSTFSTFKLETAVTKRNSQTVKEMKPINKELLTKYLTYWKSIDFVN